MRVAGDYGHRHPDELLAGLTTEQREEVLDVSQGQPTPFERLEWMLALVGLTVARCAGNKTLGLADFLIEWDELGRPDEQTQDELQAEFRAWARDMKAARARG